MRFLRSVKNVIQNQVTIHSLPHLECIRLVSVRSSHLRFKMHQVSFPAFKSRLYERRRANRTDRKLEMYHNED